MTISRTGKLWENATQFVRFAVVGVSNTVVDFGVTNLLVLAFNTRTSSALLAVSVIACTVATFNSYLWNRNWTFRVTSAARRRVELSKFFGIALLAMVVNTSTFLFVVRYLPDRLPMSPLVAVNVGKLAGVAAAFAVSFLGYRFGVFQTDALRRFRSSFRFENRRETSFRRQAGILVLAAAAVRGLYLLLSTAVCGDAVSYAWAADSLASGLFSQVDVSWANLFSFWESTFRLAGLGLAPAAVAASLFPGVALVVPVARLARDLYSEQAAWIAGLLTAVHPRLVEYSCNGYPDTLLVFMLSFGVACLTRLIRQGGRWNAIGWGAAFGACVAIRVETAIVFLASVIIFAAAFQSLSVDATRNEVEAGAAGGSSGRARSKADAAALIVLSLAVFLGTCGVYGLVARTTVGTSGLVERSASLVRQFSEQPDIHEAARATYGAGSSSFDTLKLSTPEKVSGTGALVRRLARNVLEVLERLPGVLLSPVIVFALMLPFFAATPGGLGVLAPLLLMLVFPILFYPLVHIEPRVFLPMLAPLNVLGAAGLAAFSSYASRSSGMRRILELLTAALVLLGVALSVWRGVDVESDFRFHRELARWIEQNTMATDVIAGCGYGYASTTGFAAGRRVMPRLWTDNPAELSRFAEAKSIRWIILYEAFLSRANPELMGVLTNEIPGCERVYEVKDRHGLRVQIFRRTAG